MFRDSALALLFAAVVGTRCAAGADADQMYLLVRQYTPTFCENKTCVKGQEPERMTIHGMWPNSMSYGESDRFSYCTNEKFSTSALTDETLKRMNCAWPSSTGTNEGFWSHEWEKHGTCAGFDSQEAYFQASLDADQKYDLNTAFADAGISFSGANDSPTVSQMQDAMRSAFGVGGQVVKCSKNNLYEIMMCLDWKTLEAFECDSSFWNTCGKDSNQVTFPEGSGDEAATCTYRTTTSTSNTAAQGPALAGLGGLVASLVLA